jgi:exodeoxyribonuclease VIII
MRHIMLDLETMGTAPGSAVVQIGAVEFSIYKVCDPLSITISLESCVAAGMRIDPSTVMWWMTQSDAARKSLALSPVPIRDALQSFADWIGKEKCCIWGDGAAFDNALLASAYRACRMALPWRYSADRCFRTMKEVFPVERVVSEVEHNAAADAVAQAKQMQAILTKYAIRLE